MSEAHYSSMSSTDLVIEHSQLRFQAREIGRELLDLDDRDYRYAVQEQALCTELEAVNAKVCSVRAELQKRGIIKGDNA
jgi:hypothetical protein